MLKKVCIVLIVILLFIGLSTYVNAANDFAFDEDSVTIKLNEVRFLSYSGGTGTITWTSANPSIAAVEDGIVTGKNIGQTTITATRGQETATCQVNVEYAAIQIGANYSNNVSDVNLVLSEHATENLYSTVFDSNFQSVNGATVNWSSSNSSVVTVDANTGKITAVKSGTATITARAAGVSDTCEVKVYNAPEFTDFTNAKYDMSLDIDMETLKITGIKPKDNGKNAYYYVITSDSTKPEINLKNGKIDLENQNRKIEFLVPNAKENYLYTLNMAKYLELNQDLYLWVIEEVGLDEPYYLTEDNYISHATKFVVEAKKLDRNSLPPLNLILQSFSIGAWKDISSDDTGHYTYMYFNFPSATENRKFTLRIGKVTDVKILEKIKNNDYTGITDLLAYAKSNQAVYSEKLTTTSVTRYRNSNSLFKGRELLENKAYYYIYAEFDDEDGKYYPIEGVTLGQALFLSDGDYWDLWAYTSSDFNWDNLSPTYDPTIVPTELPNTGTDKIIIFSIITLTAIIGIICYIRYSSYKEVK